MMIPVLLIPELEDAVKSLLNTCDEIYLVGGIVRDYLLEDHSHDIDFVVKNNALIAARRLADQLNGKFYVLDQERGTGRVLLIIKGESIIIDFATMNGKGIDEDLKSRDFTINAIAVDMSNPEDFYDPLNGREDLQERKLKPCNPSSFIQDPVRTIRAIRFQESLNLKIDDQTIHLIKEAGPSLKSISAERKRDELFHIFENKHVRDSCELLRIYNLWDEVFPHLNQLGSVESIPGHVHSLRNHTLQVLSYCENFINYLETGCIDSDNAWIQSGCNMLEKFRSDLELFLSKSINPQRKFNGLLYLSVLYHDLGKTKMDPSENNHEDGYCDHAKISADIFQQINSHWALSKDENQFVDRMIRYHTIAKTIQNTEDANSRLALYRFYRKAGSAGVLLGIFYLADILATYENQISEERWKKAINTSNSILEGWFWKFTKVVAPTPILNGDDLMEVFRMQSGEQLGHVLEMLREAQVTGLVSDKKTAIDYVTGLTKEMIGQSL